MKRLSRKKRERDVRLGLKHRQSKKRPSSYRKRAQTYDSSWRLLNNWIDTHKDKLDIEIDRKRKITLKLPRVMNFYRDYETTVLYINTIRKFSDTKSFSNKAYRLVSVSFDRLKKISTSAALVLTAELSKWDDALRQNLLPMIDNWDEGILKQFTELGFFDLFRKSPINSDGQQNYEASDLRLVKYIKGKCGDSNKARILKEGIIGIVGDTVNKWTFLHGGLTEAITNVSHHAYPNENGYSSYDKYWYLSGSFNSHTNELKIVFYDQGIGIPRSLPESAIWEKVLTILSGIPAAQRKRDEVLLKAAVQIERTSTGDSDRGKGLQDLLEFIRQRKDGYLSIMSLKGLYKYSLNNGHETIKSEHFDNSLYGTLIIWSATLTN